MECNGPLNQSNAGMISTKWVIARVNTWRFTGGGLQLGKFLMGDIREITAPGNNRKIKHDPTATSGVGMSRLGTARR
jgi:hypothetical protein